MVGFNLVKMRQVEASQIGNQQTPIGNPIGSLMVFFSKPSVFALQTKSEETLVSSWIDLIAFARSGAILSTFIFFNSHA